MNWINISLLEFYSSGVEDIEIAILRVNFRCLFGIYYTNWRETEDIVGVNTLEIHILFRKFKIW